MNKNNLIKISLIIFIITINILIIYERNYQLEITNIENISLKQINNNVLLKGNFSKITTYKDMTFGEFEDKTAKINLTIFSTNNLTLYKNQTYFITGKINIYNKNINLIVSKIEY